VLITIILKKKLNGGDGSESAEEYGDTDNFGNQS